LYAKRAEHRKCHGRENRVDASEYAYAYATERGMGNAARYEYQSACYDICTYYSAYDACEKTAEQRILKKAVFQY
jgi:hypothetical protein